MTTLNSTSTYLNVRGRVTQYLQQGSESTFAYFMHKLCYETEASDVYTDMTDGVDNFLVIDARSPESFAREHVPGAINIPHRLMNLETTSFLPKDKMMVVYCDGIGCNASTKGSLKLASLGFAVKEMLGGLEWWKLDGYETEKGPISSNPFVCGCEQTHSFCYLPPLPRTVRGRCTVSDSLDSRRLYGRSNSMG